MPDLLRANRVADIKYFQASTAEPISSCRKRVVAQNRQCHAISSRIDASNFPWAHRISHVNHCETARALRHVGVPASKRDRLQRSPGFDLGHSHWIGGIRNIQHMETGRSIGQIGMVGGYRDIHDIASVKTPDPFRSFGLAISKTCSPE
jgi:hypothetical protein